MSDTDTLLDDSVDIDAELAGIQSLAPDDRIVTLRGTTFRIDKLLVMDGYACLEILRSGLPQALASPTTTSGLGDLVSGALSGDLDLDSFGTDGTLDGGGSEMISAGIKALVDLLAGYPVKQWELVRRRLFAAVTFTRDNVPTARVLAGNEETAFEGLDPAHVTVIAVRALLRNFRESLPELLSLMPQAAAALHEP